MNSGDSDDQEHTGCMIALRLPIDQAARVSHPTGVPASDYHVTLAYLGKQDDIPEQDRQEIAEAVAETAQEFPPLQGTFPSGFGTFTPSKSSDGQTPYWAQPDVPSIHEFRHRLMEKLDEHGVAGYVATDHGFNPHVTIGYLAPDEEPPAPPPVSPSPITFRDVHLVFGPNNTRIPLLGDSTPPDHTTASAAAPTTPSNPPRPVRRRVSPIPAGVERVLQRMVKEHNSRVPTDLRVRTPTVRAVYARGVQGFNLSDHPGMTRDGYAFKRVSDFLSSITEHPLDDSRYVAELQDMDLLPRPVVLALRRPSLREATVPLAQAGATDLVAALVSAAVFPATDPRRRLTLSRITAAARAGGLSTALALPALQALLADGNSRAARSARARRQLRDRFGKWIEMGGGLRFKVKSPGAPGGGKWYHGTATGLDPANGLVQVKLNPEDGGQTVSVPANKVEKTKATLPGPGSKAKLPNGLNPGENDDSDAPAVDSPELQEVPDKDVTPGDDAPGDPDDEDLPPLVTQSIANLNARIPDDHPLANQRDAFTDRMRVAFLDRNANDTDADEYRADTQELIDDLDTFTEESSLLDDDSREAFQDFAGDVSLFRDDPQMANSGDGKEPKAVLPEAGPETPAATEKPKTPSGQSLMGDAPNDPTSEGKINTSGITEKRAGEALSSVLDTLRQAAKDAGKEPATGAELYNWIVSNTNPDQLYYNGDLVTKKGTDKIPVPNRPEQQDINDAARYLRFFGHNNAVHGAGEGSGLQRANNQKTAAKELARLQNTPELNPTHPNNAQAPEAPPAPAPSTPAAYDDTADIAGNLEDLAGAWEEAVEQLPPELRGDARTMRNVIYNAADLLQSGGTTKEQARDALRESLTDFEDIAYDMSFDDADTDHLLSDLTGGVWDALDSLDGPKKGAPGDADADANVVTDQFGGPVPSHWNKTGQDEDENGNPIEHWATDASNDTIDVGVSDGTTMDETGETIPDGDPVYVLRDESGAAIGNYQFFDDASDAHDFSHDVVEETPAAPAPAEQAPAAPDTTKQERLNNNLDNADRPLPTGWTAEELQGEDTDVMARGPEGHVAFTEPDGTIEVAKLNTETGQYEPVGTFDNWGDAREAASPAVPEETPTPEAVLPEPTPVTLGKPPFNILSEEERGKNGDGYHPSGPYGKYGAAGLMIRAKDPETGQDKFLIVQRGQGLSSNKGRWQFPGGALDEHETPQQGAARELSEEVQGGLGILNDLSEVDSNVYSNGTDWAYTTTLADIPNIFDAAPFPGNEWETGAAKWVTADELRKMSQDKKMIPALSNGAVDPLLEKFGAAAPEAAPEAPPAPTIAQMDTPETSEIPDLAAEVYDTSDWVKVGGQGGSNAGGTYRAPDGSLYYVKQPKSPNHAHNEVLTSALYGELGVPSAYVRLGDGGVIVSKIVPNAKSDLKSHLNDPDYLKKLQDGFVIDAWLANWDVAGLVYDNVVSNDEGNPVRIDGGGALVFRAMGTPKGHLFGDTVGEIETLRSPSMNPTSSKVFGSMTEQDMRESAKGLLNISESRIDDLVDATGFDAQSKELLKQKLKARRNDLLERFDLVNSYNAPESMIDDTIKDLDHELNAPELKENIPGPDASAILSMPEPGEPIDSIEQLDAMEPGTNIAAGEQLLKKQPDGTWANALGWDYSPDWIMQQGETALLGDVPSIEETPLAPWEQELLESFTPPTPDAIPDTTPKVRIAADGVTQLEIGDKVVSLKDGSTGTIVKHDPSDKYVKVKMDADGKVKARATKTLMLQDAGGNAPEETPEAPAPAPEAPVDEELELTPEATDESSPAWEPSFVQAVGDAVTNLRAVYPDNFNVDKLMNELELAIDTVLIDYPAGAASPEQAQAAVGDALKTLSGLEAMHQVTPDAPEFPASVKLHELLGEMDETLAAGAEPGPPGHQLQSAQDSLVGLYNIYDQLPPDTGGYLGGGPAHTKYNAIDKQLTDVFKGLEQGSMSPSQAKLELSTIQTKVVDLASNLGFLNDPDEMQPFDDMMDRLDANIQELNSMPEPSAPAGNAIPVTLAPGDPLPFTVGGRNVKVGDTLYHKETNATWVPVKVLGVKEFPDPWGGSKQTMLELQTPTDTYIYAQDDIGLINQSTMTNLTTSPPKGTVLPLSYGGGEQKIVVGDMVSIAGIDGFEVVGLMPNTSASNVQFVKVRKSDNPDLQAVPALVSALKPAPAVPETAMPGPTPVTPSAPPAPAQLNLGQGYTVPPAGATVSHVLPTKSGDRYLVQHPNGSIQVYSKNGNVEQAFSQNLNSYSNSQLWKPYTPTTAQLTPEVPQGQTNVLPSGDVQADVPSVGNAIVPGSDVGSLPVGAKVEIDGEEFTKIEPDKWESGMTGELWSDQVILINGSNNGAVVTDDGSTPSAPAAPATPETPAAAPAAPEAPATPALAQNPPNYGATVMGQDGNHLWVGATVVHPVHGVGTVTGIESNGNYLKVVGADGKKRALSRKKLKLDGVPPHSTTKGGNTAATPTPAAAPTAPPANQSAVSATPTVSAPYTGHNSEVFPPATNTSGQLVAGTPDPNHPLYQAPEPVPPQQPAVMSGHVVHETWLLAADANYKKRMKANNPSWVEKPLSQSATYNEYIAVMEGSESTLKSLLNKTRITQEMYDDALQQIQTKSKAKNEAAKAWEAEYKKYQAQRAEWLSANGSRGIMLKGMKEGALHLTDAGAYAHFWENYKPGQNSPGDPSQGSPPGQFSPKAVAGVSSQKSSSHFQVALRALKMASLKLSNLKSTTRNLDKAMAETTPLKEDIMMIRTLGADSFINPKTGLPYTSYGSSLDMNEIVGSVQHDWGFAEAAPGSLASGSQPGYHAGNVTMQFRVPKGTRGVWTGGAPNHGNVGSPYNQVTSHKGERGFILERGLAYYIHKVEKKGTTWYVDAEIIPKDVGYGDFGHFTGPDFDPKGVFYPPGTKPGGIAPVPPGQQAPNPVPGTPGAPVVPGAPGVPAVPGTPGTAAPVSV